MNFYELFLYRVDPQRVSWDLKRLLSPLGEAIRDCEDLLKDLPTDAHPEYLESIVDEESAATDNLLGVAFVVCQSYITRTVSRFVGLHQYASKSDPKLRLSTCDGTKNGLCSTCSVPVPGSAYTQVATLDAFANYFKHRAEWPPCWDRVPSRAADTVSVIRAAGGGEQWRDNFSRGARALGNLPYWRVEHFADILADWESCLFERYEKELRSAGRL